MPPRCRATERPEGALPWPTSMVRAYHGFSGKSSPEILLALSYPIHGKRKFAQRPILALVDTWRVLDVQLFA